MNESRKKFYSGIWHVIHLTAAWATSEPKIKFFIEWIHEVIQEKLPCEECRGHMKRYLEEHPPGAEVNMFVWSWKFHNAVNTRLGKETFDFETAKKLYINGDVRLCNEGCDGKAKTKAHEIKNSLNFKPSKNESF